MTERTSEPAAAGSEDDKDALWSTLDALDAAENYREWILSLAEPHLGGPVLEVGAGHGTYTAALADFGDVDALEPDPDAAAVLHGRFGDDGRVSITCGTLDDLGPSTTYGSAVMFNVLEHIADDRSALRRLHRHLTPGGHLVIWVPAFELLFSKFDRELGHHRRYRRPALERVVEDAGLEVVESRYVNLPGWFAWFLLTRLFRQRPTAGPLVGLFDRFLVPVIRAVEGRFRPPFGQSILLVARRPDHSAAADGES